MTQYVGILDGAGKTQGVRLPDLPGCYGGGATMEAAIAMQCLPHENGWATEKPKVKPRLKPALWRKF